MTEDYIPQLVKDDPWLENNAYDIRERMARYFTELDAIEKYSGSLIKYAEGHKYYGFHYDKAKKGWWYREWAPGAHALHLIGEFNSWDRKAHPMARNKHNDWEIFIPDNEFGPVLRHEMRVKVTVTGNNGVHDRIPAYMTRVVQDVQTNDFSGQIWHPEKKFKWTDSSFDLSSMGELYIYEAHVGMAQEKEDVGTFKEFAEIVLPRIKELGYNCLQLMAIMEHPYYGSFGYHVSNFFAASSRFGTPEDLKYLINKAHKMGIAVIMDIVHSHAVKNLSEGLNEFDGTGHQYFHAGERGNHDAWDSKLFDYGKPEVRKFLLSNVLYWMDEYHFDGYRFDGITSMMYFHHGNVSFDNYNKYFKDGVEWDSILYLQLANKLIHDFNKDAISIAEDMSGMPGLCRLMEDGGIGFDYRLGMGLPDFWIKLLKHTSDENWNINEMWSAMINRRHKEKTVAYAESHDQALVGDKTIAFWLMDKEMYYHMHKDDDNIVIDRGVALHKMIRLFTASIGGESYLTFIGNEFGHPEWVDFPREGNGWSYKYAQRKWSLADNPDLKYQYLQAFDGDMIKVLKQHSVLSAGNVHQYNMDDWNKTMIFEKAGLIFIFNFHLNHSIPDYKFWIPKAGKYKIAINSDSAKYGGHDRIDESLVYKSFKEGKDNFIQIYIPNRTAIILEKTK